MGGAVVCCFRSESNESSFKEQALIRYKKEPLLRSKTILNNEPISKIYSLGQVIGKGYFSKVRLGHKLSDLDKTPVAIKIVKRENFTSQEELDFMNELSILKSLDHPNVIKLTGVYSDENSFYLVMENLSGGSLEDLIKKGTRLPEPVLARVLYQSLAAVNYLHSIGVCHRDIKPDNVLFKDESEDSEIKLIDFGLSKKFNGYMQNMTSFLGTPYYVAPEVISRKYDKRCDLWSLGATAFCLITGHPPFMGKSKKEVLGLIEKADPNYVKSEWSGYSKHAINLIKALLEKNPKKRISAEVALNHSFFDDLNKKQNRARAEKKEILEKLSKFTVKNDFTKLIMSLGILNIPRKQEKELNAVFHWIDSNHEGFISKQEMKSAFEQAHIPVSQDDIDRIFAKVDFDENGMINFSEFQLATTDVKAFKDATFLKRIFDEIDVEKRGKINYGNLKTVVKRMGNDIRNSREIKGIFKEANEEEDMDFEKFEQLMGV